MPSVKATWLFNGLSTDSGKSWGFSETWYAPFQGQPLLDNMDIVSAARRLLLPDETSIVGYRIGNTDGRAYVVRRNFNGSGQNGKSNLPIDCALCEVGSANNPAIKRFFLHDLPDQWIEGTRIIPLFNARIVDCVRAYVNRGFQVRTQNQLAVNAGVLSIDAGGNVVLLAPIALALNNLVSFLKCKDTQGRPVRGSFAVDVVTDATHFHIAQWKGQTVSRSGKVRLVQFNFNVATFLGNERTITGAASRKPGRPFFQLRGRVPVRR